MDLRRNFRQKSMRQYKSPKSHCWDMELANITAYVVDSKIKGLHYIVDGEKMAMVRHYDMIVWDIADTPSEAEKFINKVKQEILDIYADIKSLRSMTVKYEEVKLNT